MKQHPVLRSGGVDTGDNEMTENEQEGSCRSHLSSLSRSEWVWAFPGRVGTQAEGHIGHTGNPS